MPRKDDVSLDRLMTRLRPVKIIQTGVESSDIAMTVRIAQALRSDPPAHFVFYALCQSPEVYLQAVTTLRAKSLLTHVQLLLGSASAWEKVSGKDKKYAYLPDCLLEGCMNDVEFSPDFVVLGSKGSQQILEIERLLEISNSPVVLFLPSCDQKVEEKRIRRLLAGRLQSTLKCSDPKGLVVFAGGRHGNRRIRRSAGERNSTKKVAIVLIEHMGDIVACEPVARFAKEKYPGAHVTWVVREPYRQLVENSPYVDEVLVVECLTEWSLVARSKIYDEIIDLHINNRECPHCGIRFRKWGTEPEVTLENYYEHGTLLGSFCKSAGLPELKVAPHVYIPDFVRKRVDGFALPDRYIVVHCKSNEYERDWEDSKWQELAGRIRQIWDGAIVEIGSNPCVSRNDSPEVINLCGKASILESAEIIKRARLFIGVDSGPAHLANAVGTYGIVLLGRYHAFARYMPYTGRYGAGETSEMVYARDAPARSISVNRVLQAASRAIAAMAGQQTAEPATAQQKVKPSPARLLAFYLPQFHPIPENDLWWGKGFTEWRNVAQAKPLYKGHYQPHLPGELGFYDLRLHEVMSRQAELAAAAGIEAFCFWHYWFNGKMLLEGPINRLLESGSPRFPFCLAWANENWTRRWDGQESEILFPQSYGGAADDRRHFEWLVRAFKDPRYFRVEGRPVFLIYRPFHMKDASATISCWRRQAKKEGIEAPYLIAVDTNFDSGSHHDPRRLGFDAVLQFQPNSEGSLRKIQTSVLEKQRYFPGLYQEESDLMKQKGATVCDYDEAWPLYAESTMEDGVSYATVVPSWDNSSRRANKGAFVLNGSTPSSYERWLEYVIRRSADIPAQRRLVFVNAWNEWAEGNHLEPDIRHGSAYLESTLRACQEGGRSSLAPQEMLNHAQEISRVQPLLKRVVRKLHQKETHTADTDATGKDLLNSMADALSAVARSRSIKNGTRRVMTEAMRALLKSHESFPLVVQFYNYASGLEQVGKKPEARLLFAVLGEITDNVFPEICGKCHYKLALLSAGKRDSMRHLSRCVQVYPQHRAASELLKSFKDRRPARA